LLLHLKFGMASQAVVSLRYIVRIPRPGNRASSAPGRLLLHLKFGMASQAVVSLRYIVRIPRPGFYS